MNKLIILSIAILLASCGKETTTETAVVQSEIKLMTESKLIDQLINLAKNPNASQTVRAIVRSELQRITTGSSTVPFFEHRTYLAQKVNAFLTLPEELTPQSSLSIPDGAPIGMEEMSCDFEF